VFGIIVTFLYSHSIKIDYIKKEISYSKGLRKRAINLVIEENIRSVSKLFGVQYNPRLGNSKKQESPKHNLCKCPK